MSGSPCKFQMYKFKCANSSSEGSFTRGGGRIGSIVQAATQVTAQSHAWTNRTNVATHPLQHLHHLLHGWSHCGERVHTLQRDVESGQQILVGACAQYVLVEDVFWVRFVEEIFGLPNQNFILCLKHRMLTVSSFIAFLSMWKDVLFLF